MALIWAELAGIALPALLLLLLLAVLRALLALTNRELTRQLPRTDLRRAFLVGIRFDAIIVAAIALVPELAHLCGSWPTFTRWWFILCAGVVLFAGVAELEFYRQFNSRLNSLVFDYLREDTRTVTSMIWNGCPVKRYLALWAALMLLFVVISAVLVPTTSATAPWWLRALVYPPVLALTLLVCRGTLRHGPPLRWGDAYHSEHLFANHLALNGTYTLIKAILDVRKRQRKNPWRYCLPKDEALATTSALLLQPGDTPAHNGEQYPVRRHHRPQDDNPPIKNVVVILMESFAAPFVGALDGSGDITPQFDRLARQGVLFDHFFSNGTHTHQGVFATMCGFPNLPGFEYLMQKPQGATTFSGLVPFFNAAGYNSFYIYNGDFAWDNQEGFFRHQGMSDFIGRDDFVNPQFVDPTWGVSDHDMFQRAHQELEQRCSGEQPVFAIIQTLSNHLPFTIPDPLPVERVSGFDHNDDHLTAMRYADWALGQFFAAAANSSYYNDTLFVLLGDHGFCVPNQLTDIQLLRFHIPLLFLAPGMQQRFGNRRSTVATQVDVAPTIMGLLGREFTHQCWGRNLFNLSAADPGFGIIKPSGNDPTVAAFKGEHVLVHPHDGAAQLYRYQLYPEAGVTIVDNPALNAELVTMSQSYIQTATNALMAQRVG